MEVPRRIVCVHLPLDSLHFIPREKYWVLLKPALGRVSFAVTQKVCAVFGMQVWGACYVPGTVCTAHNNTLASLCSLEAWLWFSCLWNRLESETLIRTLCSQEKHRKGTWRVAIPRVLWPLLLVVLATKRWKETFWESSIRHVSIRPNFSPTRRKDTSPPVCFNVLTPL